MADFVSGAEQAAETSDLSASKHPWKISYVCLEAYTMTSGEIIEVTPHRFRPLLSAGAGMMDKIQHIAFALLKRLAAITVGAGRLSVTKLGRPRARRMSDEE
jgi:hypothetical protein